MNESLIKLPTRSEADAIRDEWIREMQNHKDDRGRFQILPSEAARVVAEKRGLTVEAVLAITGSIPPRGGPPMIGRIALEAAVAALVGIVLGAATSVFLRLFA